MQCTDSPVGVRFVDGNSAFPAYVFVVLYVPWFRAAYSESPSSEINAAATYALLLMMLRGLLGVLTGGTVGSTAL